MRFTRISITDHALERFRERISNTTTIEAIEQAVRKSRILHWRDISALPLLIRRAGSTYAELVLESDRVAVFVLNAIDVGQFELLTVITDKHAGGRDNGDSDGSSNGSEHQGYSGEGETCDDGECGRSRRRSRVRGALQSQRVG